MIAQQYAAENQVSRARMLPAQPAQVPAALMRAILVTREDDDTLHAGGIGRADGRGEDAAGRTCTLLFDEHGAAAFAASHGQPDCPTTLRVLAAALADPERYDHYQASSVTVPPNLDGTWIADVCLPAWRPSAIDSGPAGSPTGGGEPPGPPLGRVTLTPHVGGGWIIAAARPC